MASRLPPSNSSHRTKRGASDPDSPIPSNTQNNRRKTVASIGLGLLAATGIGLAVRQQDRSGQAAAPLTETPVEAPVEPVPIVTDSSRTSVAPPAPTFSGAVEKERSETPQAEIPQRTGFSTVNGKTVFTVCITPEDLISISANLNTYDALNYLIKNGLKLRPGYAWDEADAPSKINDSNALTAAVNPSSFTVDGTTADEIRLVFTDNRYVPRSDTSPYNAFTGFGFTIASNDPAVNIRAAKSFDEISSFSRWVDYAIKQKSDISAAEAIAYGYSQALENSLNLGDLAYFEDPDPLKESKKRLDLLKDTKETIERLEPLYDQLVKINETQNYSDIKKAVRATLKALAGSASVTPELPERTGSRGL